MSSMEEGSSEFDEQSNPIFPEQFFTQSYHLRKASEHKKCDCMFCPKQHFYSGSTTQPSLLNSAVAAKSIIN